ncbi:MAG: hypothetical protein QM737_01360 [Ferruginibacter sp.]
MKITVHYSTKTGTIKQAFNKMFPYLKIEFITAALGNFGSVTGKDVILHNRYLGEINDCIKQGSISIHGDYKAAFVEQLFRQSFGLRIMVFRKQKKQWIPVKADDLTLSQQNEKGKESCIIEI